MFTIIGGDGKEYGPATVEQLRSWIAAGRANLDTQARAAGTEEWRRLGDFPAFDPAAADSAPAAAPTFENAPVAPSGPVDARSYADTLIGRARPLDVFGCLSRSFDLWKRNFLPLVGVTLLVFVLQMVVAMIPIVGSIAGLFLNGVFYGGLYYYYLGKMRGQPRELADIFAGFSQRFVPLMLASLMISGITLAIILVTFGPAFAPVFMGLATGAPPPPEFSAFSVAAILIAMVVVVYLSIAWMFAIPLIIDQGLGPWTAMEVSRRIVTRQWFRVFFVVLLGSILTMLGLIAFFIGIFFTLPLVFGAMIAAYEELVNPPAR